MIRLGLTGSMATGKSTVAAMFRKRNIPIYDADKAVHELYENEAIEPVGQLFPDAIIEGKVDRAALGKIVLNDKEKLAALEKIVHPLVHEKMKANITKTVAGKTKLETSAPRSLIKLSIIMLNMANLMTQPRV